MVNITLRLQHRIDTRSTASNARFDEKESASKHPVSQMKRINGYQNRKKRSLGNEIRKTLEHLKIREDLNNLRCHFVSSFGIFLVLSTINYLKYYLIPIW